MEYGKIITKESYHKNNLTVYEKWYQIPVLVKDKSSALTEILKTLELISDKKTRKLIFSIEADKDFRFKLLTKEYEVQE